MVVEEVVVIIKLEYLRPTLPLAAVVVVVGTCLLAGFEASSYLIGLGSLPLPAAEFSLGEGY